MDITAIAFMSQFSLQGQNPCYVTEFSNHPKQIGQFRESKVTHRYQRFVLCVPKKLCLSLGDIDESVIRVESLEIVPEGSTEEEEEEEEEAAAVEADDESERNVCFDNNPIVLT